MCYDFLVLQPYIIIPINFLFKNIELRRNKKIEDIGFTILFLEYCGRNNCATTSILIDYIHPLHEEISAAISSSKKFGDTLSESSPP